MQRRAIQLGCLFVVFVFLFAGCLDSGPAVVGPELTNQSALQAASDPTVEVVALPTGMVPFRVHWQGTFRVLYVTEEVGAFEFDAVGNAIHMGESTLFTPLSEVILSTGVQTAAGTITAANGDQLNWSILGTAIPGADGNFQLVGDFTIAGGTGRFSGATGGGTYAGIAGPAGASEGINDWTMTGTISRPNREVVFSE